MLAFAEDPVNPQLAVRGDRIWGLFSLSMAEKRWVQMKGGLRPLQCVTWSIQARESDLVIATFGRGFYMLTTSRLAADEAESLQQAARPSPRRPPCYLSSDIRLGGQEGFPGDAFYTADNPPFGAVFTLLEGQDEDEKEKRQEAEKDAAKKNATLPYPSHDELRAEAQETKPELYFVVYDESGAPIRRVEGSTDSGFQRAAWDLRYPASRVHEHSGDEADDDFPDTGDLGPLVLTGNYSVRLFSKVGGVETEMAAAQSFKVVTEGMSAMNIADRTTQEEFLRKVARLYRAVYGAQHTAEELASRLKSMREALRRLRQWRSNWVRLPMALNSGIARYCGRCAGTWRWRGGARWFLLRSAIE